MKIRYLKYMDAPEYKDLRQYSLVESPFAFSDSYEDEKSKKLEDYQKEIELQGDPPESFTLGAFSETGELTGFVKFRRDNRSKARHRAVLYSLYVKPSSRSKGIASLLVRELLKIAETIPGLIQLQLSTIVSHHSLIEFYQRLGFRKLGGLIREDLIINDKYVDAWYMVNYLKQKTMNKSPVSTYKIRFHDCDMFGHLNNARYLDYMINARQDHLKDTYNFDYNSYYKNNLGWVINYHEIQYLKPVYFEETVSIQSSLLSADRDSLHVEIIMMNEDQSQLKAVLRSRLTFINLKTGRKEQHTDEFLEMVNEWIQESPGIQNLQERIKQLINKLKENKNN